MQSENTQQTPSPPETPTANNHAAGLLLRLSVLWLSILASGLVLVLLNVVSAPIAIAKLSSLAALAIVPTLLLRARKTELLLPYMTGFSMLLAYNFFKLIIDETDRRLYNTSPLTNYTHIGGIDLIFIVPVFACLFASAVYLILLHTPKLVRLGISLLARSLVIYLIFFSASAIYAIADQAQQEMAHQNAVKAQQLARKITINPQLQVYQPSLPNTFTLTSPPGSLQTAPRDGVYQTYVLSYAFPDSSGSLRIEGSLRQGSQQPVDACRDVQRLGPQAPVNACKIVLTTNSGIAVAGYRPPDLIRSFGYDPETVTEQQIRTIQPQSFYFTLDGELLQISYSGVSTDRTNPITPAFLRSLVDGLKPMNSVERQQFINQHLKPEPEYVPASRADEYWKAAERQIFMAAYFALFLWAIQRVFEKAGRPPWAAYIPPYNLWVLAKISQVSGIWLIAPVIMLLWSIFGSWANLLVVGALFGPIPIYIAIISAIISLFAIAIALARRFGEPAVIGILAAIPPYLGLFVLGFGNATYEDAHAWDLVQSDPPKPSNPPLPQ